MANDEELQNRLMALEERNAELEARIAEVTGGVAYEHGDANREHKDRLFRFIFGRSENRRWALDLYNAVAGRDYDDPDLIEFNTIEDALYLGMRNDVSFLISAQMVFWEHQSTWNPNMPMRFFLYGARLYEAYISSKDSKYSMYSETLQKVPKPRCVCFYNGTREEPDRQVLRLSDAFIEEPGHEDDPPGDFEAHVTVLNVNYGRNAKLMEACEPLREYSWLVDAIRRHNKACEDLDEAVDMALREMPDGFLIREFPSGPPIRLPAPTSSSPVSSVTIPS